MALLDLLVDSHGVLDAGRPDPTLPRHPAVARHFRALITVLANGGTLNLNMGASDAYSPLYSGNVLGIPVPIIIFAVVAAIAEVSKGRAIRPSRSIKCGS